MEGVVGAGLVPEGLEGLARSIPGLRNILVHGYAEIRHDLVYEVIRGELDSLALILRSLLAEAERLDP